MKLLATVGIINPDIAYTDRPTVKMIVKNSEDKVLIINDGLLPGGGIGAEESTIQALERELREEIGATVSNINKVGVVIQYRDFLKKRYVISGYTGDIHSFDGDVAPQDIGESLFSHQWLTKHEALLLVDSSIKNLETKRIVDDSGQGKLFNLMTTRELLSALA